MLNQIKYLLLNTLVLVTQHAFGSLTEDPKRIDEYHNLLQADCLQEKISLENNDRIISDEIPLLTSCIENCTNGPKEGAELLVLPILTYALTRSWTLSAIALFDVWAIDTPPQNCINKCNKINQSGHKNTTQKNNHISVLKEIYHLIDVRCLTQDIARSKSSILSQASNYGYTEELITVINKYDERKFPAKGLHEEHTFDIDLNFQNKQGQTLLMTATLNNQIKVVKKLIEQNVDINIKNHLGFTALTLASKLKHHQIEKLLLEAGASPEESLINIILEKPLYEDASSNIYYQDEEGRSLLVLAILDNHIDSVKKLINRNTNLNTVDNQGYTALMKAAQLNHYEIVEVLINSGADINFRAQDYESATQLAFKNESLESLEHLINAGGTVSVRTFFELLELLLMTDKINISASKSDYIDIAYNKEMMLPGAIVQGDLEKVKKLIDHDTQQYWGDCTPLNKLMLILAVLAKEQEIVNYLCSTLGVPKTENEMETILTQTLDWICSSKWYLNLTSFDKSKAELYKQYTLKYKDGVLTANKQCE